MPYTPSATRIVARMISTSRARWGDFGEWRGGVLEGLDMGDISVGGRGTGRMMASVQQAEERGNKEERRCSGQ